MSYLSLIISKALLKMYRDIDCWIMRTQLGSIMERRIEPLTYEQHIFPLLIYFFVRRKIYYLAVAQFR